MTAQKKATLYWWLVLAASVGLSSYANIRHARLVAPGSSVATWTAGLMPVALLVMVEGMAFATRAGILGTRRKLATVGVGVLAAIVLVASYVGVLSTVRETHLAAALPWLEFAMAAVPDLLMIFATMYVMGLRASDADDEATTPSRWARVSGALLDRAEHAVVGQSDEFRSTGRPTTSEFGRTIDSTDRSTSQLVRSTNPVDQMAELVDRALDEQSDELVEQAPTEPVDHPVEPVDRTPDELVDRGRPSNSTGPEQAVHADERAPSGWAPDESVEFGPIDRSTTPDESVEQISSDRSTESAEQVVRMPVEQSTDSTDWVALAERVKAATSITADTADLAVVLRMDAEGASRAEIAAAVGRAKSTVSGWIKTSADGQSTMTGRPSAVREEVVA